MHLLATTCVTSGAAANLVQLQPCDGVSGIPSPVIQTAPELDKVFEPESYQTPYEVEMCISAYAYWLGDARCMKEAKAHTTG